MFYIKGQNFVDEEGRTIMLRGVNLAGTSKIPFIPNGATHLNEKFYSYRDVSFIGRPFPIQMADEHFTRLKSWGFNTLRLLVTWEAIEHEGPGLYDQNYLEYIYEVVKKAHEYDLHIFIDFHQDVWSRLSGGDGAPGWTFEEIGMNAESFSETGAAIIHNIEGDPYPHMIWPTNYCKLACATMFTLFFGGNVFAKNTRVRGQPVQEFLQSHYINAMKQLVYKLKDLPNIIGYDLINEPSRGYIGWEHLERYEGRLLKGEIPTPFQSMLLGRGVPQNIDIWELKTFGFRKTGTKLLNPNGKSVWLEGFDCIWKQNGVWDIDTKGNYQLLIPDYFSKVNGDKADFSNDFLKPFINRAGREIRSIISNIPVFIETDADRNPPNWGESDFQDIVYAPHWYDAKTLVFKNYTSFFSINSDKNSVVFGQRNVQKLFDRQLSKRKEDSKVYLNSAPIVIGEFGIPFNMKSAKAYNSGDFYAHEQAINSHYRAMENNLLNCTLWNYSPDNDNCHGDLWNAEDFSIFSNDQRSDTKDINSGGRALKSIVRPYAVKTPGEPVKMSFDPKKGIFLFEFNYDINIKSPAVIFIPIIQYPKGIAVEVSDGSYKIDYTNQIFTYYCSNKSILHKIMIMRRGNKNAAQ